MRRAAVLLPLVLLVAACGGGSTKPNPPPAVAAPPAKHTLHVVIRGQDHRPRVGRHWQYEVRVTGANGKPVAAHIHLQFLFGGVTVGEVGKRFVRNGVWRETFGAPGNPTFPPASRGQPLVLQATVTAPGYAKAKAGWPVRPR
jgi:hypothetical protein